MNSASLTVRKAFQGYCLAFAAILGMITALAGCKAPVTNPVGELADSSAHSTRHWTSIEMLRASPESSSADSIDALQGLIYRPGYSNDVRVAGIELLMETDPDRLVRTTRQRLARINDAEWLEIYCKWLGSQKWAAPEDKRSINEALISSWGVRWSQWPDENERPERLALVSLNGGDQVIPLIFETFQINKKASKQGLRNRCWELLHRLDQREALIELVRESPLDNENSMMVDLRAAADDLGMVPYNREEILWLRKLREPERQEFWEQARQDVQRISEDRRRDMELRDIAVVVAASRHRPDLLSASSSQLYQQVESSMRGARHYYETEPGMPTDSRHRERLYTHRDQLTWGDLAAISLAQEALSQPAIVRHLFDYGSRDEQDKGTEYGGIIQLDDQGRFEIREFIPKIRHHDRRFNASQEMFNAGYTALYHMHFHAQRYRNALHAGPGLGDMNYADNTRTNNLVFTFVDKDTMNVDFYRHGQIIVDLGTIKRPGSS
ncbi:MAG: hypothetical protein CMJ39_05315 [Phycisphaerae bacterium]|nr:hypothetical protein [Phycisphaerae bacterium]|tara:strand:+ start:710 stop:2197 length:1488 start_codon:yes stop_codon:yes gene_type:complete